jgi:hypothetical protein
MKHKATAAAAVAAGLALALGAAAPGTASASAAGAWTLAYRASGAGVFTDIAAISQTNAWAVGHPFNGNADVQQPIIRHYDGTGWKAVTIPGGTNFEADHVAASGARNVWVYGLAAGSVLDSSAAYRYDGSSWHKVPVPPLTVLVGMVTFGSSNTWAISSESPDNANAQSIFHWDGSRWHRYDLGFTPMGISASSAVNVWVAGLSAGRVAAYRWDGSAWHAARIYVHPGTIAGPTMLASAPTDLWIGWETPFGLAGALHWNGHHWSDIDSPANLHASIGIVRDGVGGNWFGAFARFDYGSKWTGLSVPAAHGGASFGDPARIPGTRSAWLPASTASTVGSVQQPTIYHINL